MPSYHDIERITGLSIGTISNVLQGKETVKPENRIKVMEAVEELGYRINYQARGLASEKNLLIGLVIATPENIAESRILMYMENFAEKNGYRLMWATSRFDKERERRNCETMLSSKVDCLFVLLQSTENEEYFRYLSEMEKTPIILLGRYFDTVKLPFVAVDNYYATNKMVRYLYKKGHRSLTYIDIAEQATLSPNRDRRDGVLKACREMGIESNVVESPLREDDYTAGYLIAQDMILNGTLPKTLVLRDDASAIGLYNACTRYDVKIPQDVSIMGFGKLFCDYITPKRLTTFQPEFNRVVDTATKFFLDIHMETDAGKNAYKDRQCFIRGHIVEGETVADLNP